MNGFCYMIPEDFTKDNIQKLPLLVDGTKQTFRTTDGEVKYNYGMGGYGMAVHYTQQVHVAEIAGFNSYLDLDRYKII